MKLVISLATRGRPNRVIETVKRSVVNWTNPNTELQIQVDADDKVTIDALQDLAELEEFPYFKNKSNGIQAKDYAHVCKDFACSLPINSIDELEKNIL